MSPVGFEPTIPVFERTKTDHTLDCSATAIGGKSEALQFKSAKLVPCPQRPRPIIYPADGDNTFLGDDGDHKVP
jgi:hypothetical protein